MEGIFIFSSGEQSKSGGKKDNPSLVYCCILEFQPPQFYVGNALGEKNKQTTHTKTGM